MKPEQLYNILDIEPPKPEPQVFTDLIISNRCRYLFKLATEAIVKSPKNHAVNISDMSITRYNNNEVITTKFRGTNNPEQFRGMTIRNLYIEESVDSESIKSIFGPMAKNILTTKQEEE